MVVVPLGQEQVSDRIVRRTRRTGEAGHGAVKKIRQREAGMVVNMRVDEVRADDSEKETGIRKYKDATGQGGLRPRRLRERARTRSPTSATGRPTVPTDIGPSRDAFAFEKRTV
jgi:hypothetical protein